ncbi:MAG TPA: hypothetical protein VL307_03775, partial [Chitinophagaceae bacterium]|nr:hypothetical protein [Chitinophagaceae bacterium]
ASNTVTKFQGFENWQSVAMAETEHRSALPVSYERPFIIQQVKPVQYNNQWWLQDAANAMVQLKNEQTKIWKLLSFSGGHPLNMVVLGKEQAYEPMGVWYNDEYKIL